MSSQASWIRLRRTSKISGGYDYPMKDKQFDICQQNTVATLIPYVTAPCSKISTFYRLLLFSQILLPLILHTRLHIWTKSSLSTVHLYLRNSLFKNLKPVIFSQNCWGEFYFKSQKSSNDLYLMISTNRGCPNAWRRSPFSTWYNNVIPLTYCFQDRLKFAWVKFPFKFT